MAYSVEMDEVKSSEKVFTLFLILSLIGNVYLVKPINIGYGEILILIGFIAAVFVDGFKLKLEKEQNGMWLFVLYALIITGLNIMLYSTINISETIKRIARDGFYWVTIFVFSKTYFNSKYAYKLLNIFCMLLSALIIIQFVSYLLFGIYVPGLISGIPTDAGDAAAYRSKALVDASILGYIRPNGFLSEPAQCAHILSISLFLNLMHNEDKRSKVRIIIYSIATVCTTSLNGIVLMVFAYLLFYLRGFRSFKKRAQINTLASFLAVLTIMMIAYLRLPFVQSVLYRLTYLGNRTTGSVAMRVMRGPVFYLHMPLSSKILGIGFGNFIGFREATKIWTAYEEAVEYFGMNSYILISTGIVGSVIFLIALYNLLKGKVFYQKGIVWILFVAGLSSSLYSTAFLAVAMSFALFGEQLKKDNSIEPRGIV